MKHNLCKKCKYPYCCHYSILIHTKTGKLYNLILKNHICKYLDKNATNARTKGSCLIFKNRFKVNPYCLTIKEAIRQFGLPKECLYVKDNIKYQNNIPKLVDLPDDITDTDKEAFEKIEQLTQQEFTKKFLPLIL